MLFWLGRMFFFTKLLAYEIYEFENIGKVNMILTI